VAAGPRGPLPDGPPRAGATVARLTANRKCGRPEEFEKCLRYPALATYSIGLRIQLVEEICHLGRPVLPRLDINYLPVPDVEGIEERREQLPARDGVAAVPGRQETVESDGRLRGSGGRELRPLAE
jgi:hypothetical protein